MFRQRLWMIPIGQWVGYLGMFLGIWLLSHDTSLGWIGAWVLGHIAGGLAISVALHRYFCHGAFQTSRFWHWVMALYSCLVVQGSPLAWAAAHQTHHEHMDTARDPHDTGVKYLWWKTYRDVPMSTWRLKHLVGDTALAWVHRNTLLVVVAWVVVLVLVGLLTGTGPLPLVFGYLAPMGTVQLVGAVHQVISHVGGYPRDMPWLEWVLPAAGEWNHKFHHENARAARLGHRWWHLDYGYLFIRLIRTS